MDGKNALRLHVALAATAVLALGGVFAPSYAQDAAPVVAAAAVALPAADASLPQFQAPADSAAPASDDTDAAPAASPAWQPIGRGMASWYGPSFKGHRTASGERFDPSDLTAAHRTLPFGTRVRVTNAAGDSVIVRINDRGPFAAGRVIDLSRAAAAQLGITRTGSGRVTLAVLDDNGDDSDQ